MITVGVVAHSKKTLGGGLDELRVLLRERGYSSPLWFEVSKSRDIGKAAREAVAKGATLLLIWGGDGSVQRCVDAIAGLDVEVALLPAGTANLLANNLSIPRDLKKAVDIAFDGRPRTLDVGIMNGKCFTVMAGIGFDAVTMQNADGSLKERFGRLAYLWTGAKALRISARKTTIRVDGKIWFKGNATCVLFGQMNSVANGVFIFPKSEPDDGLLEVGVVTAKSAGQWVRVITRMALGSAEQSPFTEMTQGRRFEIKLNQPSRYELDGGARRKRRTHKIRVKPGVLTVRVPSETST